MNDAIGIFELAKSDGKTAPDRFLLLKDGDLDWAGLDLSLDEVAAQRIIAKFNEHGVDLVIDFEHATTDVEAGNREKAPAAGWIKAMEFVPGEGLFASEVEWTDEARRAIEAKEFKYTSPVVAVAKDTDDLLRIHSVALVNRPRTREIPELLAASENARAFSLGVNDMPTDPNKGKEKKIAAQDEAPVEPGLTLTAEQKMMARLSDLLGLPDEAGLLDILTAAVGKLGTGEGEGDGEAPAEASAPTDAAVSKLAAELGLEGKDVATLKTTVASLTVKAGMYDQLSDQVKELTTERDGKRVAALIKTQVEAGKINPNDEKQMAASMNLAQSDPDQFKQIYGSMPAMVEPGSVTKGNGPAAKTERQRLINAASKDFDKESQFHSCSEKTYVNCALDETAQPHLSDAEAEVLVAARSK